MADIELARAYVEIIPVTKGIQQKTAKAIFPDERDTEKEGKKHGERFAGAVGGALAAGATAIAAGAAIAGGAAVGLYKVGAVFDDVSDTIRIGSGASGEALAGLEASAKAIGRNVPVDMAAVGPAVADLNTRLGLTGKNLETVAAQVLNAGHMLGEEIDINTVSGAFSAFRIEGDAVAGSMDTLFQVSQATGVGMNELAGAVQANAPALQNLGFGFEETASLVGVLDKAGMNATQVMTSMSRGLVNLAKDGEEPVAAFERVTGEIQGMIDAGDIAGATDLAGKVFGTRGATQFVGALQSGKLNMDDLKASVGATGDTINGLAAETADLPEQWQMFKNSALTAIEPIGSAVFGLAGDLMGKLTPAMQSVGGIFETIATGDFNPANWSDSISEDSGLVGLAMRLHDVWADLEPVFSQVGASLTASMNGVDWSGVLAGFEPLVAAVGELAPAFAEAWGALSPLSLVLQTLGPVLPMLAGAVSELVGALGGALVSIAGALIPVVGHLTSVLSMVVGTILEAVIPVVSMLVGVIAPLIDQLVAILAPILVQVAELFGAVVTAVMPLVSALLGLVVSVLEPLLGILMAILTPVLALAGWLLGAVVSAVSLLVPVVSWLADVLGVVVNVISGALTVALNWVLGIMPGVGAAVQSAGQVMVAAWNGVAAAATWLWQSVIEPVWNGIKTAIAVVVAAVMTYIDLWKWYFTSVLAPVFTWLWKTVVRPVWEGIQAAISAVVSWFQNTAGPIIRTVIDNIKGGFDRMRDAIQMVWFRIRTGIINPVLIWFLGTVKPTIDRLTRGIGAAFNTMKDTVGKAWDAVKDKAKAPIRFVVETVVNNALVGNFNKVAEKLGVKPLPRVSLPKGFARGGILPGWSRESHGDDQLVAARRGEGWMVSEALRTARDRALFLAANAAGRRGVGFADYMAGVSGFAGGGIVGDLAKRAKNLAGDALDRVLDGVDFVAEAIADPGGMFSKLFDAVVGPIPAAGLMTDVGKATGKRVVDGITEAITGAFGAGSGSGGDPAGVPVKGGKGGSLGAAESLAKSMGLVITSRGRRGARTAKAGLVSLHALGRAIDVAGSPARMMAFFNAADARWSPTELLYSPAGARNLHRSGRRYPNSGATLRNHYSHVHIGFAGGGILGAAQPRVFDNGGWLKPGQMGINLSNRPEPVFSGAQWDVLAEAVRENGGRGRFGDLIVQVDDRGADDPSTFGRRVGEALELELLSLEGV